MLAQTARRRVRLKLDDSPLYFWWLPWTNASRAASRFGSASPGVLQPRFLRTGPEFLSAPLPRGNAHRPYSTPSEMHLQPSEEVAVAPHSEDLTGAGAMPVRGEVLPEGAQKSSKKRNPKKRIPVADEEAELNSQGVIATPESEMRYRTTEEPSWDYDGHQPADTEWAPGEFFTAVSSETDLASWTSDSDSNALADGEEHPLSIRSVPASLPRVEDMKAHELCAALVELGEQERVDEIEEAEIQVKSLWDTNPKSANPDVALALISAYKRAGHLYMGSRCFWNLPDKARSHKVVTGWLSLVVDAQEPFELQRVLELTSKRRIPVHGPKSQQVMDVLLDFGMYDEATSFVRTQAAISGPLSERPDLHEALKNLIVRLTKEDRHDYASFLLFETLAKWPFDMNADIIEAAVSCMSDEVTRIERFLSMCESVAPELPNQATWQILADAYARKGDVLSLNRTLARSRDLVEEDLKSRAQLQLYVQRNFTDGLLRAFHSIQQRTIEDYNLLLRFGVSPDQVLPEIYRSGRTPSGGTFGILAAMVYRRRGADLGALTVIMKEMAKAGIDPRDREFTRELFAEFVRTYSRAEVRKVMAFLVRNTVDRNRENTSRLVRALVRGDMLAEAEYFYEKIAGNPAAAEALVLAYLRREDVRSAKLLMKRLTDRPSLLVLAVKRTESVLSGMTYDSASVKTAKPEAQVRAEEEPRDAAEAQNFPSDKWWKNVS